MVINDNVKYPIRERSFNVLLAMRIGVNGAILLRQLVTLIIVAQHMDYGQRKAKRNDFQNYIHNSKLVNPWNGVKVSLRSIHTWLPWASFHTCWNCTNYLRKGNWISVDHIGRIFDDYSNYYFINFSKLKPYIKYD